MQQQIIPSTTSTKCLEWWVFLTNCFSPILFKQSNGFKSNNIQLKAVAVWNILTKSFCGCSFLNGKRKTTFLWLNFLMRSWTMNYHLCYLFLDDPNFLMQLIVQVGIDESTRYSNRYHQSNVKVKGVVYRISTNFWYFKTDTFYVWFYNLHHKKSTFNEILLVFS